MKHLLSLVFAATALSFAVAGTASAAVVTTCTTVNGSASEAPVSYYLDKNGHKWVGFKPDGSPPDSQAPSVGSTTCTTTGSEPT
ncbi:hypothetical protein [Devosia sp.]|jgi:hypothetical protein|uniref:hypothetical protein n=1 Tax=Devosia sp. TaxID=1871048 RepID=UPI0037C081A5